MTSAYVISALMGNCQQESSFYVGAVEQGEESNWTKLLSGFGLFQWTNSQSSGGYGRRYNMQKWMHDNASSQTDGYKQLEYLRVENIWQRVYNSGGFYHESKYNNLTEFLNSTSTDIQELTEEFCWHWEIPSYTYANVKRRVEKANIALQILSNLGSYATIAEGFPARGIELTADDTSGYFTESIAVTKAFNTAFNGTPPAPHPTDNLAMMLLLLLNKKKKRRLHIR